MGARGQAQQEAALRAQGLTDDAAWDLDLAVWKAMADGVPAPQLLPFALDEAFLAHLALKGAACWSLQSNARQHPVVAAVWAALPRPERFPPLG
ncbi:MAG: hypothetical protein R3F59_29995 [Myxococcota bacterium]